MASYDYRLVIIGAGSGGVAAIDLCVSLGVRSALVEKTRIGGECTWTGCVPSKALIHAAHIAHSARHAASVGVNTGQVSVDFPAVMRHVRNTISRVYATESPDVVRAKGVDVHLGEARFVDAHTITVGDRQTLTADKFVIASGARATIPPIPGLADVPYWTNETLFDITERPNRFVVMGGGPIGCEMAQAFARLGSQVTVIQTRERLLPAVDPDAAALLADRFRAEGIQVILNAQTSVVRRNGDAIELVVNGEVITADGLLVATGRTPNVDLDLDRAGVAWSVKGITVDRNLRTTMPNIYAAGDVTGGFQFTHVAGWQAAYAVRNALLPGSTVAVRQTVPTVTYVSPEIGEVGLSESAARAQKIEVDVERWPLSRVDRAQTEDDTTGFIKLIADKKGTLVGATVMARVGGELINELALAVEQGLKLSTLASTIHPYPTYGFGIQQAAAAAGYATLGQGTRGAILKRLAR